MQILYISVSLSCLKVYSTCNENLRLLVLLIIMFVLVWLEVAQWLPSKCFLGSFLFNLMAIVTQCIA
jgi:hypothetical protein